MVILLELHPSELGTPVPSQNAVVDVCDPVEILLELLPAGLGKFIMPSQLLTTGVINQRETLFELPAKFNAIVSYQSTTAENFDPGENS